MKRKIKNFMRDLLRFSLGKKKYTEYRFYLTHGYKLNLKNPRSWNEKLQYRKFNCNNFELSKYVDKFEVRKYIKSKGFEEKLIPLLGVFESIDEEIINDMPNSFVIKTSNGGGGENVRIIKDKTKINGVKLCKQFNGYLKIKSGKKVDELYYDVIKPKIIFEKLLLDSNQNIPKDYKLHCFRVVEDIKIFIQVDEGRFLNHRRSIYDSEMKKCCFKIQPKYEELSQEILEIENFNEMRDMVEKIFPQNLNYIRIDLYNLDGKIYFGEMTFSHGSGFEAIKPKIWDYKLGELWKLEK